LFDRAVKQEKSGGSGALVATDVMLICGGSNAQRLHKEMQEQGIAADLLHIPNLRVIRDTGEVIAAKIKEAIAKRRPASIIFQFLDNSVFQALTEEWSRIPPRKLDGRLHFDGDIVVADKAAMTRMLRICRPTFNATEDIPTVMIGPLPRYVSSACCGDPEHMANRCTPGFLTKMKSELDGINRTIKEFLHNLGYNNIRAMDPWVGLGQLDVKQIWGTDPVHIKREHLAKLVEGVKITLSKLAPKRRRDSTEANLGPPSMRGKTTGGCESGSRATPGEGSSNSVGGGNGGNNGGNNSSGGGNRGRGSSGAQPGRGGGPVGNTRGRGGGEV
jgi:hypothetical protein